MAAVASRGSTASAADEASNPGHDTASGYVAAAYAQEKGCKGTPGSQAAREQQERAPAKPAKGVYPNGVTFEPCRKSTVAVAAPVE